MYSSKILVTSDGISYGSTTALHETSQFSFSFSDYVPLQSDVKVLVS